MMYTRTISKGFQGYLTEFLKISRIPFRTLETRKEFQMILGINSFIVYIHVFAYDLTSFLVLIDTNKIN